MHSSSKLSRPSKVPEPVSTLERLRRQLQTVRQQEQFYTRVSETQYLLDEIRHEHFQIRKRIDYIRFLRKANANAPEESKRIRAELLSLEKQVQSEVSRIAVEAQAGRTRTTARDKPAKGKSPAIEAWELCIRQAQLSLGFTETEAVAMFPRPAH